MINNCVVVDKVNSACKIDISNEWEKIDPEMIYNRLDLIMGENSYILTVENAEQNLEKKYIPVHIDGNIALLGIWGTQITQNEINSISNFIFAKYPLINAVSSRRAKIADYPELVRVNDFHIDFPDSSEEFDDRVSSKGRYNIRRSRKVAENNYGKVSFESYSINSTEINDLFEKYFSLKKVTHNAQYGLSAEEYIKKYYVSDIYSLKFGENVVSLILSCEQCPCVYLENLTYDVNYGKYSPGAMLYDEYLRTLINKRKRSLYLKGGDLEYKKRYGSIEEQLTTFKIYRNEQCLRSEEQGEE